MRSWNGQARTLDLPGTDRHTVFINIYFQAAAGASVLSDRLCIATNGAIQHPISFEQAATCSSVQYNKTAT